MGIAVAILVQRYDSFHEGQFARETLPFLKQCQLSSLEVWYFAQMTFSLANGIVYVYSRHWLESLIVKHRYYNRYWGHTKMHGSGHLWMCSLVKDFEIYNFCIVWYAINKMHNKFCSGMFWKASWRGHGWSIADRKEEHPRQMSTRTQRFLEKVLYCDFFL